MGVRLNIFSIRQVKESSGIYDVDNKRINSPEDANNIINKVLNLSDRAEEVFGILTLSTKNQVAGVHIISIGTLNSSLIHPREVFKAAILNNAASIIAFHNHPSGDSTPSKEDVQVTQRLIDAGNILGINVFDHIVVGENEFTSLKSEGLI
jgi:DNA repair proteins